MNNLDRKRYMYLYYRIITNIYIIIWILPTLFFFCHRNSLVQFNTPPPKKTLPKKLEKERTITPPQKKNPSHHIKIAVYIASGALYVKVILNLSLKNSFNHTSASTEVLIQVMMMIIDRVENRENPTSFAPNRAILSYHLSKQHIRTNFH